MSCTLPNTVKACLFRSAHAISPISILPIFTASYVDFDFSGMVRSLVERVRKHHRLWGQVNVEESIVKMHMDVPSYAAVSAGGLLLVDWLKLYSEIVRFVSFRESSFRETSFPESSFRERVGREVVFRKRLFRDERGAFERQR